MAGKTPTFWEHIYNLRSRRLVPRVWRVGDLREFLERPNGPYTPRGVSSIPGNSSISIETGAMGDYVTKGAAPKVWKVGRGQFQLIADPEDDEATRQADRDRAGKRAEELRARKMRVNGGQGAVSISRPDARDVPTPQTASSQGHPDQYPSISIDLTPSERQSMARLSAEQKAVFIVHKHLIDKYGDRAEIEEDQNGADLRVSIDGKVERIEVKGTESTTIAWPQLKVSSQKSHDALRDGDTSMYRVVDVAAPNPRIYILTHGRHFTLEPEPRWAVKRVPPKDDRYPLRGEPYRYDLPYEPVAAGEWEVRE